MSTVLFAQSDVSDYIKVVCSLLIAVLLLTMKLCMIIAIWQQQRRYEDEKKGFNNLKREE
jgi:hypothetical protein